MKKSEHKPKKNAPRKKREKKKSGVRVLLTVIAVVLAALAIGAVALIRVEGRKITMSQTILPNVTLGEISVGGLTREEAVETLRKQEWDKTEGGTLQVELPQNIHFAVDYFKAGAGVTAEEAAEAAFRFGHDGSDAENLMAYLRSLAGPKDLSPTIEELDETYIREQIAIAAKRFAEATDGEPYRLDEENAKIIFVKGAGQMKVDEEELYQLTEQALLAHERKLAYELPEIEYKMPDFAGLREQTAVSKADAYYDPETDTIVPDVKGVDFDLAEAERLWKAAEPGEEVFVDMTLDIPEVTEEMLKELLFHDCLGEQMTHFWGSTKQRINNINLVAQKLDGLVMMPGDEFSYNDYVGERTEEAGFQAAQAYADGQVVYEIGGGVCQVSSTLYNAVLKANLEVLHRECHYFPVAYLPKGLDATVSWPKPNFSFKNNRDYPIRLKAWVDDSDQALNIQIWGSNIDGTYVEPVSSWWAIYDEEFPTVQIGWGAASWRDIYNADGEKIDHVYEANSQYFLHDEDIQWPPEKFQTDEPTGPEVTVVEPETPAVPETPSETQPETPSETTPETPSDETIITG